MLFNRACVGARLGQLDSAMADLTRAVRLDPRWYQDMASDDDLEPLRQRADFAALAVSAPEAPPGGS